MINFECKKLISKKIDRKNLLFYFCNSPCDNVRCKKEIERQEVEYSRLNSRDFKAGDLIRIRQWDDMAQEFGISWGSINCECGFPKTMGHLCGKTAIISSISSERRVTLRDFKNVSGRTNWAYSIDMIEHA